MAEATVPMVYVKHRELPVGASRGIVGLEVTKLDRFDWEGDVATEITDYSVQCSDGMKGSIDAAGMAALIDRYVRSILGKQDFPFTNVFKEGYGNFTNTLVNYNDHCDDRGVELEPKEGFARTSVIHNPKDFKYNDEKTAVFEADENARILRGVYIPGSGFMALTEKGFLNPRTGLPYKTVEDQGEGVESFISRGFPRDIAEFVVSYFFSREEDEGIGAVGRGFFIDNNGRFSLNANYDPDSGSPFVGRLASR